MDVIGLSHRCAPAQDSVDRKHHREHIGIRTRFGMEINIHVPLHHEVETEPQGTNIQNV